MKKHPYSAAIWMGVMVTLVAAILLLCGPPRASECISIAGDDGTSLVKCCTDHGDAQSCQTFQSHLTEPIIALEFAKSGQEIKLLLEDLASCDRAQLRTHTQVDFIFIFVYTSFLFCVLIITAREYRRDIIVLFLIFPLAAAICDFLENISILNALAAFDGGDPELSTLDNIARHLQWQTWAKWLSLAFTGLLCAFYFLKGNQWHKITSIFLMIPFALGVAAFFIPLLTQWFVLAVSSMFLVFLIFASLYRGHISSRRTYF